MENNEQNEINTQENVEQVEEEDTQEDSEPTIEDLQNQLREREEALENERKETAKYKRIASQKAKKAEKSDNEPLQDSDVDYGLLAFHNTNSDLKISATEDVDFLRSTMAETGKSQADLLNAKWFQSELKERQETRASKDAVPRSTKRTNQGTQDDVGYWENKVNSGQAKLNDIPDLKIKREVLNRRIAKDKSNSTFAPESVKYGA